MKNSPFDVFLEGIGIYTKHFPTLVKYMAFPVLGQFLGLILCFVLSLGFAFYASAFIDSAESIFITTLILTIPGLIILVKAFWEYLIAYVAVSSMTENTQKSGRIYDIDAHKQVAAKRMVDFIGLWLIYSLFLLIALIPPMWVFSAILFVFICLIFQVFALEKNETPMGCFKRSFSLVKTNFWGTLGLLILVGGSTYWLLPKIVDIICTMLQIVSFFGMLVDPLMMKLPISEWNAILVTLKIPYIISSLVIAKAIVSTLISTLVIAFTLPLRSICFTLWYKSLATTEVKKSSKSKKKDNTADV